MPQRVAVTGVVRPDRRRPRRRACTAAGHDVVRLVRRPAARAPTRSRWDPASRHARPRARSTGVDAVVNLAGAGVGDHRWTAGVQAARSSPHGSTAPHTVATALAAAGPRRCGLGQRVRHRLLRRPRRRGPDREPAARGRASSPTSSRAWESATKPAADAGIRGRARPHRPRPVAREGGAMARLLPLARLGLGGPLGSGRQCWPWITLEDEVGALTWAIDQPDLSGPVNLTGPQPLPQIEVTSAVTRPSAARRCSPPRPSPSARPRRVRRRRPRQPAGGAEHADRVGVHLRARHRRARRALARRTGLTRRLTGRSASRRSSIAARW